MSNDTNASVKQQDDQSDNNTRKRRLSKRERKNLKKKKIQENSAGEPSVATPADVCENEPTREQYMADYSPSPIAKHLSKQESNETTTVDSLGKWFPKATVIKSSVCYSNDYLLSLTKQNLANEPKASLVLFYQYVSPTWSAAKVSAFAGYITSIVKTHRTNLGGRIRISTEGVNCTVSAASTDNSTDTKFEAARTLRHFAQDLRNFDADAFSDTDFKYIDGLSADRHFKEMKILPVKELVFYGIREDDKARFDASDATMDVEATTAKTTQVLPQNAKGGIHLDAKDYHEMLKENNTVVIDVRNHYEAAIGRFDGQMYRDASPNGDEADEKLGAQYIDPKMRKSTDFTSWLEEPETKQKLEGKTVMMFCTGGIRCERASAYLNSKMGSDVKGVFQLKGGIERYLQAFPDGGFWRGKNFVFDKREAIGAGNVNGDGGVIRKKGSKESSEERLPWGTECAKCKCPWDRYVGKRKCWTCGVPILLCDSCMSMSQSYTHKKKKQKKNVKSAKPDRVEQSFDTKEIHNADLDEVRCPLCVEQGITIPAEQVEYTDNGVRGRTNSFSEGGEASNISPYKRSNADECAGNKKNEKKAAKSVLKWGGGHASKKKEKRRYSRKLCQFGVDCIRKDCFFYHPERGENKNIN